MPQRPILSQKLPELIPQSEALRSVLPSPASEEPRSALRFPVSEERRSALQFPVSEALSPVSEKRLSALPSPASEKRLSVLLSPASEKRLSVLLSPASGKHLPELPSRRPDLRKHQKNLLRLPPAQPASRLLYRSSSDRSSSPSDKPSSLRHSPWKHNRRCRNPGQP